MDQLLIASVFLLSIILIILIVILVLQRPQAVYKKLQPGMASLENRHNNGERLLNDEMARNREESAKNAQQSRAELSKSLQESSNALLQRLTEYAGMQKGQLDSFARQLGIMTQLNQDKLETMRKTVEGQLQGLREDTGKKLEQMRSTVDEKLQSTLEKRLAESFQQVSQRLEQVYKGLGEMRSLAAGVGDLKKVLTNVKTRGTWGEIQLGAILEQTLTRDQYDINVATKKNSRERVEFAIKLPGHDPGKETIVWMPIDAKFPQEDYQRLIDAQESADKELADKSIKNLENRIKAAAKDIRDKYIDPPNTTDFGIMFLPVEGLYAEVLRIPGLSDTLQREYRVVITGPTTISALLNSLQMGFRTLAIEKRSSEVWQLLDAVKTDFGNFGDILLKTKKKLQEASNTIDQAAVRSRAIERKLRDVGELPLNQSGDALQFTEES